MASHPSSPASLYLTPLPIEQEQRLPVDVVRVKHKYRVGEACWTNWNGRYLLVLVHRLHQRLAVVKKPLADTAAPARPEGKARKRRVKEKSSSEAGGNFVGAKGRRGKSSGRSKSSTSSWKSSCSTSGDEGRRGKAESRVNEEETRQTEEEKEDDDGTDDLEAEDELRHIPICFISFVGWGERFFEWRDEEFLLSSDDATSAYCHAHNQKMLQDTRGLKAEAKEDVIERFKQEQNHMRKERPRSMLEEESHANRNNASEKRKENNSHIFTFPPRLANFLEKDAEQIRHQRLIALPKPAELTLARVVHDFQIGFLNICGGSSHSSGNGDTRASRDSTNGAGRSEDHESPMVDIAHECESGDAEDESEINSKEFTRMLLWLHILVEAFDLHFVGRGLYDSQVEITQMRKIIDEHGDTKKLSQLVGVEHFLRFLSSRVLGNHFLQRVTLEDAQMLCELKNVIHLFLIFVDERWELLVGEHV